MRRRGTSLVELLVCLIVLGLCAGALLTGIGQAGSRAGIAGKKTVILAGLEDRMSQVHRDARINSYGFTGSTETVDLGLGFPVTYVTTVSTIAGYTDLYEVRIQARWNPNLSRDRSGTMQLVAAVLDER